MHSCTNVKTTRLVLFLMGASEVSGFIEGAGNQEGYGLVLRDGCKYATTYTGT